MDALLILTVVFFAGLIIFIKLPPKPEPTKPKREAPPPGQDHFWENLMAIYILLLAVLWGLAAIAVAAVFLSGHTI